MRKHLSFSWHASHAFPLDRPPVQETVSPLLQRFLDQLDPSPAYITGRRWDILAWNRAACTVIFGDVVSLPAEQRNIVRFVFTNQEFRCRVVDWEGVAVRGLAQFRVSSGNAPGDPWFTVLIDDLKRASREFREWWPRHEIKGRRNGRRNWYIHSLDIWCSTM